MTYNELQMAVLEKRLSWSDFDHLQKIINKEERLVYGDQTQVELLRSVTSTLEEYYLDDVNETENIKEKLENIDIQIEEYEREIGRLEDEICSYQDRINDLEESRIMLEQSK